MARSRKDPPVSELLAWYDRNRRRLPWRVDAGEAPDPYRVWLSEVMLQQTTVASAAPYFRSFIARWPDVESLAAASLESVLHAWQGLGYYARARNLHRCAQMVVAQHGGRFPDTEAGLRALPGVGRYTAAAVAAIAFGRRAVVLDGNIERVLSRVFAVDQPLPGAGRALYDLAERLTPHSRPGDYAQAVMDLGATICTPRAPRCGVCPWVGACRGRHIADTLPRRAAKPERPTRRGVAFWIIRHDGAVLLRRRPERGLLGGMVEFPSTAWCEREMPSATEAARHAPMPAPAWRPLPGIVRHSFTHFHLELGIVTATVDGDASRDGLWSQPDDFGDHALPTVMKKVARHALRYL